MSLTDPIADFLTCIRNGLHAKRGYVDIPHSKMKVRIAEILKEEGFIGDFEVVNVKRKNRPTKHKSLRVHLCYLDKERRSPVIEGIKRISTPGRRVYVAANRIPSVRSGIGVAILSTSNGVVSDRVARRNRWGGEIICNVW
ncbi:30S ribosomal protein S8 [bacterium]|nr:30S ribosomal protein S8 [bacterium]